MGQKRPYKHYSTGAYEIKDSICKLPRHNFRIPHVIDSLLALFLRGVQISIGDADDLVTAKVSCQCRAALLIVLDIGDEGVTEMARGGTGTSTTKFRYLQGYQGLRSSGIID